MGLRFQAGACPGRFQGQAAEGPLRQAESGRQGASSPLLRPPNTGNGFLVAMRTGVPRVFFMPYQVTMLTIVLTLGRRRPPFSDTSRRAFKGFTRWGHILSNCFAHIAFALCC